MTSNIQQIDAATWDKRTDLDATHLGPFAQERLPFEILGLIFSNCTDDPAVLPPTRSEPRLSISSVCSTWRAVALGTPELWNEIVIKPLSFDNASRIKDIVRIWLARSSNSHLSVNALMDIDPIQGPAYSDQLFELVHDVILPYSHRIRKLAFPVLQSQAKSFFGTESGSFPIMEEIEILMVQDAPSSLEDLEATVFDSLPRLRRGAFQLSFGLSPLQLNLPWEQMTHLDLKWTSITPHVLLSILERSLFLEECAFQVNSYVGFGDKNDLREVTASSLKRCQFLFVNPSLCSELFQYIILPNLHSVSIETSDHSGWSFSLYTPLLSHSAASIKKLELNDTPLFPNETPTVGGDDLEHLLSAVPNLEELEIPFPISFNGSTLNKISTGDLLPRLEHLCVRTDAPGSILFMAHCREKAARELMEFYAAAEDAKQQVFDFNRYQVARIRSVRVVVPRQESSPNDAPCTPPSPQQIRANDLIPDCHINVYYE